MSSIVQSERIRLLNDQPVRKGEYVLYWMQQSQRAQMNHALEYAIQQANDLALPVVVGFGLTDNYPEANLRHYQFLLEGLQQTGSDLKRRRIQLIVRLQEPPGTAIALARQAALVVCDRGYLRFQKQWRKTVAEQISCRLVQVETDVIVPVEEVSPKAEYAARTIRPRIHRRLAEFLQHLDTTPLRESSLGLKLKSESLEDSDALLKALSVDTSVPAVTAWFRGGTHQAQAHLRSFLKQRLESYVPDRNHPHRQAVSRLSPYLHFGQISPLEILLKLKTSEGSRENKESFAEELLVRRELGCNFVNFTPDYDSYSCLPGWARQTLQEHAPDARPHRYTLRQLEEAQTHDPYWNASMKEMRYTGYMHNYMRMYWGKKILEWSRTPEHAYRLILKLNNKYFLDGRDPNAFSNAGWIFGLHDRPWFEREIFGKVRYMSSGGLKRKTNIDAYVQQIRSSTAVPARKSATPQRR